MNINSISLIFKNTFAKEWRSKTLLFLLVLTFIMMSLAVALLSFFKENVLTEYSMAGLAEQSLVVYFWIINIWSFLVATFIGVSTISSDFEERVIGQMLSFPISRAEYLIGRLGGAYAIVTTFYAISLLIGIFGVSLAMEEFTFNAYLLLGLLITSIGNLIVITLAIFVGLYFSKIQSFILCFLGTFFISLANGHFEKAEYFETFKEFSVLKWLAAMIHGVLPHLAYWEKLGKSIIIDIKTEFNYGVEVPHLIFSYAILVILILALFKKKEI